MFMQLGIIHMCKFLKRKKKMGVGGKKKNLPHCLLLICI